MGTAGPAAVDSHQRQSGFYRYWTDYYRATHGLGTWTFGMIVGILLMPVLSLLKPVLGFSGIAFIGIGVAGSTIAATAIFVVRRTLKYFLRHERAVPPDVASWTSLIAFGGWVMLIPICLLVGIEYFAPPTGIVTTLVPQLREQQGRWIESLEAAWRWTGFQADDREAGKREDDPERHIPDGLGDREPMRKSGIRETDCTESFFAEYPASVKSSKYIGKRLTVAGRCSSYGDDASGGHAVLDEIFQDMSAMCHFQAIEWKMDEFKKRGLHSVSGTLKGLRSEQDIGLIELVDCRIEQESPPPTVLVPPPGSHELQVSVGTVGIEKMEDSRLIGQYNASLKSVKCYRTDDQLIIGFDIDKSQWMPVLTIYPLLVRLFDRNGEHLTHFTTVEGFTADSEVHRKREDISERFMRSGLRDEAAKHKCILLKPTGNRVVYGVNVRDLRDASMVEIGFSKGK